MNILKLFSKRTPTIMGIYCRDNMSRQTLKKSVKEDKLFDTNLLHFFPFTNTLAKSISSVCIKHCFIPSTATLSYLCHFFKVSCHFQPNVYFYAYIRHRTIFQCLKPTSSHARNPHSTREAIRDIPTSKASSSDFITSGILLQPPLISSTATLSYLYRCFKVVMPLFLNLMYISYAYIRHMIIFPLDSYPQALTLVLFIYLFGVLRRFQHCTGHITTSSWKGRGQYIQFVRVLYCKLPTNGKQLPTFSLEAVTGTLGLRGGRRECYHSATVAPSSHSRGPHFIR